MRIIKVSATNSTNSFAKDLYKDSFNNLPVCVIAEDQTAGRGQRGASWQSNAGENLTFSIIYPNLDLGAENQFLISAAVAVAIYEVLKTLNVKNIKIKWPNDIMAANKKVGGILIENFISNGRISAAIIGVGLNVNQQSFIDLPHAASLSMVQEEQYELDNVLKLLLFKIEKMLVSVKEDKVSKLMEEYHDHLFRINKPSTFQLPDNSYFVGVINGIASSGKLMVQVEGDQIKEFDIKEVKLCY